MMRIINDFFISKVRAFFWRALNSLISVRYKGLCAEYLAGPKKGGNYLNHSFTDGD
jgi:hypothetical protein